MKTLTLNLRRVRSSLRTDINTGSRSTQSGGKSYGVGTGRHCERTVGADTRCDTDSTSFVPTV
ncbi:MAG: hypothetical protein U0174_21735 [Polyangiaceae bacterium]